MAEKLRTSHDLIECCGNSLTKSDYIKLWDKLEQIYQKALPYPAAYKV